jgi:glycolate oxidase
MLRRAKIDELCTAVGADGLITGKSQLQTYECDALTNLRAMPDAVVLPRTAGQAQAVVRLYARDRIPFVSRGAGTGLSGGALPAAGAIVISLARMNRILEVDFANRQVVVEPGVINAHVTQRVAPRGYFYAPDPSSQSVCTIGRQRGGECQRRALPQMRFHDHPRLALDVVPPSGELVMRAPQGATRAGMDIGGYVQRPDWPKMGPSLLIGAFLILAVRTVKWPPRARGGTTSDRELDVEIENAIHLAGSVLSSLDFRL